MSGDLPNNKINKRLEQLEKQLDKAKRARDDYLQQIETANVPNEGTGYGVENRDFPMYHRRPGITQRLEVGQYFWDAQVAAEGSSAKPLPTSEPIPSGIALSSDLAPMTKRLREIGASLRNLREYRLNVPSDVYFQSVRPHVQQSEGYSQYYGDAKTADLLSMAEIRSKLLNLEFTVEKRSREILSGNSKQQSRVTKMEEPHPVVTQIPTQMPKAAPVPIEASKQTETETPPKAILADRAETSKKGSPAVPKSEDENFQRMLDILRPKVESEEEEEEKKEEKRSERLTISAPLNERTVPSFLHSNPIVPTVNSKPKGFAAMDISDSDSEFFK